MNVSYIECWMFVVFVLRGWCGVAGMGDGWLLFARNSQIAINQEKNEEECLFCRIITYKYIYIIYSMMK